MKLIVGLGNPGPEYTGTRHNVGFAVIDMLAERNKIAMKKRDFKSVIGDGFVDNEKIILIKPMTYMNLSGEAVASVCRHYKIDPSNVWVIVDDVALPTGKLRLRLKGSAGGHNGLTSVEQHLHTQDYPRLRIGVGSALPGRMINHVLGKFNKDEQLDIAIGLQMATEAVESAIKFGFENSMNLFNKTEPKTKVDDDNCRDLTVTP